MKRDQTTIHDQTPPNKRPKTTKPTSVDLFAGCGGIGRGFDDAGIECVAFNEINKDAADSYALNFPNARRFDGDIRNALTPEVIEQELLPLVGGVGAVDFVTGGPPCQGFSGIGHRRTHKVERKDITTNHLYHEMIRVIVALQPKAFLFENVQGLLSARWTKEGTKGEIFRDVWKAFSSIEGYTAQPTLVHAYGFGVPQNRPRVMIMGVRHDVFPSTLVPSSFDASKTKPFQSQLRNNGGFFPVWDPTVKLAPDLVDALGDLQTKGSSTDYVHAPTTEFQRWMRRAGTPLTEHEVSNHSDRVLAKFKAMHANNGVIPDTMKTKKFSQRLLPAVWPAQPFITVTSMPDDYVHYALPRTFSVREWARLQTFPDHHQFAGKRTTGGARRAGIPTSSVYDREVPKYTQIGNSVPPRLAEALGRRMRELVGS